MKLFSIMKLLKKIRCAYEKIIIIVDFLNPESPKSCV